MATTPARMIQRRRTAAQWASENPVLAAGEFGVESDTGVVKVGNGTTAYNTLLAVGSLTTHDALYRWPDGMHTNGTLTAATSTDTGMPRITLADNLDQRVKWMWEIPVGWDGITVRFGWVNETAGAGDVKFQFAYKLIYLGEGNVDGSVTTISFGARTAGGQFDFVYENAISELASIATPDVLGKPFMHCSLSRLGAGGPGNGDTLGGGASVFVTTATRVEV